MIELRGWQRQAKAAWLGSDSGVASVVTGAGKTVFAIECAREKMREWGDGRVMVVVPGTTLQDQWQIELTAGLGLEPGAVSLHGGGHHDVLGDRRYSIAVVNTARRLMPTFPIGRGESLLIADECHRYGAPANRNAIDGIWNATLGLSATPVREYDDWFERYVAPVLGPVFYEYSYADALRDHVVTPFSLEHYLLTSAGMDANSDEALRQAVTATLMDAHRGEQCLLFHERIVSADALVRRLAARGHRVVAYHSQLSPTARLRNLALFRKRQVDVLVTCRALDEGFDIPGATFGLIVASTRSTRQRIQRIGRLVRRAPGKESAVVATLVSRVEDREVLREEASSMAGLVATRWFEVRQ